ncbi:MAG: cation diffusion facilitator family transporter [Clostridiales bacterium]|nr:cation diffusion facilitator family transporter [Clostridiales bacterium]
MIRLLSKIFIKNPDDTSSPEVRQAYGMLCGIVGICLNILLFTGKFLAGTITRSVSITADAVNNLSDAASSVVILIGFKMAGAEPDPGHPFGHGRIEYISGLIVSGAILIMAYELVKSSVEKIIHPEKVEYNTLALVILIISIAVKLYMCFYNRSIGKKLDSSAMRATATDSFSDSIATFVVLIAAIVEKTTNLQIDGYCGVLVGVFIFIAGITAARDTLNPLLGQPPEPEFVEKIKSLVTAHPEVLGIHDLIVHDYGPGRQMISLHAEVPAEGDILALHDAIDNIEHELKRELRCDAVIHMDPVVTMDEQVQLLKEKTASLIHAIDPKISMHDFRVVAGPTHVNLIFDVLVPFKYRLTDNQLEEIIRERIKAELGDEYFCAINVDKGYAGEQDLQE